LPNLNSTDWLIVLLYLFSVLAIGFSLRSNIKTSKDFLQAGRSMPAWICALAFIAASLGSQEVIAMGAAGAKYGFKAALFFSLGAIPALLFAGVFMMPLYYGSGARTVPEYLGLRFECLPIRGRDSCRYGHLALHDGPALPGTACLRSALLCIRLAASGNLHVLRFVVRGSRACVCAPGWARRGHG
jgi:hypothetical protein